MEMQTNTEPPDIEVDSNVNTGWQKVLSRKRESDDRLLNDAKRTQRDPRLNKTNIIEVQNKFNVLQQDLCNNEASQNNQPEKQQRPPPIHLKSEIKYTELCKFLSSLVGNNNFKCSSTKDGVIIYPTLPAHYRTIVHQLRSNGALFYTYQLREDKPYRFVIRGLHNSVSEDEIKEELHALGHEVRRVTNVLSRNKVSLPLFFVDIEPNSNNAKVFDIETLLYSRVKIEEPRNRRQIVQCKNCQRYGHTRSYCTLPSRCVKCAEHHDTKTCSKSSDTPATCALCNGQHPSNYRGCQVHQQLRSKRTSIKTHKPATHNYTQLQFSGISNQSFPHLPSDRHSNEKQNLDVTEKKLPTQQKSYSFAASQSHNQSFTEPTSSPLSTSNEENFKSLLSSFMTEMKNLLTPIIALTSQLVQLLLSRNDK
jgi:hypothetical protein